MLEELNLPGRKGGRHRYPSRRKTPVHHRVKGYSRDGYRVSGYTRGSGTRTQISQRHRSRVVGRRITDDDAKIGVHGFVVNFKYSDKPSDGESVLCISDNFADALDEAYEEKVDSRSPMSVEVIDPDIGAMLEWTGKRVKSAFEYGRPRIVKATKLGAKYAVKATMATVKAGVGGAKELGRLTAFAVRKEYIQSMLKLCFQADKSKRIAARVALKRQFPEVYAMCSFSRE